ncbi:MAG: DUF3822 family protein [Prevotella sp.]|nr:DUF3822 family protein [Prevotella sp.]
MQARSKTKHRLTLRIGRGTMAFAMYSNDEGQQSILYEPYVVKSGVSIAANLREAFKTSDLLLQAPPRVRLMLDTDVLFVPVDLFSEQTMDDMLHHAFPETEQDAVCYNVVPDLNCVALFAVNRDLRLVVDDHFSDVQVIAAASPVWRHLHQRSYTGASRKLFGYFHERRLDIFSFQQNRFKFFNSYEAGRSHDAIYFLLYVWKQLQLNAVDDGLHLAGNMPEQEWLLTELRRYLQRVFTVNPQADFQQSAVRLPNGMPYDLQTLFLIGR